jgi:hypothetical protein
MSSVRITNTTDRAATPEPLRDVRARAWAYVIDCWHKKEAAASPEGRPNDAERNPSDSASNHSTA